MRYCSSTGAGHVYKNLESEKWKVSIDLVNVLENVTFIMLSSISFLSLDIIKARTILAFLWALFRKT